jgi:hypothetical protein
MGTAEPVVGDAVTLKGRILKLDGGVALVEVYRAYPVGGTVAVQCGGLELTEDPGDGGEESSDEELIRRAMAEAADHPGRIVTVEE